MERQHAHITEVMLHRHRLFAKAAGVIVAAMGGTYFAAWMSGVMTYRGLETITMKTNAALCLFLLGVALVLAVEEEQGRLVRWIVPVLAVMAMTIGGLTFLEHLFSIDLGIDQLLAREHPGALGITHPNRMGPPGAVSFTLGGACLLLLSRGKRLIRTSQTLAVLVCVVALLGILGYLYGADALYGAARYTAIAWPTTLTNFLLGTGLLCARPDQGIMAPITAPDAEGGALRRLLLASVLIPICLGWLRLQGEWHGLYERYFGTSILVLSWVVIFSWLVYQTGKKLSRSAVAERAAVDELQRTQTLLLEAERLSHTGAWQWDLTSGLWTFSDEWLRIHGIDRQNLYPHELLSIAHPDDRPLIERAFEDLRRGAGPYDLEHRVIQQNTGKVRIVRARGQFLKAHGRVVRIYGFAQDITAQKRAEEALKESEGRLRLLVEHAPAALAMFDRQMRYMIVSRRWLNDYGLQERELIGKSHYEIFPDLPERWREVHQRALGGAVIRAEEEAYQRADGAVQWLRWEVLPWYDASGEVAGLILFTEDITPRKHAELALSESESLLRKVLETLPVGVWILAEDGKVVHVNRAAQEIWAGAANLVLEKTSDYKGWWLDSGRPIKTWEWGGARAIRGESALNEEVEIEAFDGTRKIILSSSVPIRKESGEIAGAITVNQEITRRKRAEEELLRAKDELEMRVTERTAELSRALEELSLETDERIRAVEELRRNEQMLIQQSRLAAMGEMLANIAHQWRQPLNVVGLILQELSRGSARGTMTQETLQGSVIKARQLIEHMSHTIDDFRNFFTPEKTKMAFNLKEVIEASIAMLRDSLSDIRVDAHYALEAVNVVGYRNEFAQALINILNNARDVFRERSVANPTITVRLAREKDRNVVTIADNAGGIPAELTGKIFDPYFTTKGPDKGTGIGLFMSKTIIEKNMGGRLTVRNTAEGAEFRIEV